MASGKLAPLVKQALAKGTSADDLVAANPNVDEKALRKSYAQVKSRQKAAASSPKKKASKKTAGKKPATSQPVATAAAAPESGNSAIRKFLLEHGLKAVRDEIARLGG